MAKEIIIKLETTNARQENIIQTLNNENQELKREILVVKQVADNTEQKSRSTCLLLHGVPENDNERTDELCLKVINVEVDVAIALVDVECSHRIGPKKVITRRMKPRPIIVKCSSNNKKKLKNKAKAKFGQKAVLTSEGRIFAKVNNQLQVITTEVGLEKL